MGLAGLLLVDDDEEDALALPASRPDLHCVLQDRTFDEGNQFVYPARKAWPAGWAPWAAA
jgi:FtsP/CotA-like multicopper oxidase with cupredoxin domain